MENLRFLIVPDTRIYYITLVSLKKYLLFYLSYMFLHFFCLRVSEWVIEAAQADSAKIEKQYKQDQQKAVFKARGAYIFM